MTAIGTWRKAGQAWAGLSVLLAAGCQAPGRTMPDRVEMQVAAVAPRRPTLGFVACAASATDTACALPLDLAGLWRLALAHNPTLREAAADVEAARGKRVQAGKYPNPHFLYAQDVIGSRAAPSGNMTLQITQEIVTAGKRELDMAIASRETDAAMLALVGRKYDVLRRLRRAYHAYLGALETQQLHTAAVTALASGVASTRTLVDKLQNRPRTDLLRLEALYEETKISQLRSGFNVTAAWKQVAAEVGVPELPMPPQARADRADWPSWDQTIVWQRVKSANNSLRQAAVEVESARLAVARARADAIPNITVGGGYINAPVETTAGAIVTLETPLPLWDRKQGSIREAEARWVKAQAAERTLEVTLAAATAEAFARYQGALHQLDKLSKEVLPRVEESLDLLRKNYALGGGGVAFSDVLMTEQSVLTTRLTIAETRQSLWGAIADLQAFMQLDLEDDWATPS